MKDLTIAARAFVVLSVLTGLLYPLAVTGIAQVAFPWRSEGSLVVQNGKTVGSELIGQSFESAKYLWGRPSATGPYAYNAAASSGSNLGPTNPALMEAIQGRIAALRKADPENSTPIPTDLVTASGSGLDPHISVAAATYQAGRVARARGIPESRVTEAIVRSTEGPGLGFLGELRVNVLLVNLDLDRSAESE